MTPRGFSLMTKMVKTLAENLCHGRLVLALEGESSSSRLKLLYSQPSLCYISIFALAAVRRFYSYVIFSVAIKPNTAAVVSLQVVVQCQRAYWNPREEVCSPLFRFHLPFEWRAQNSISRIIWQIGVAFVESVNAECQVIKVCRVPRRVGLKRWGIADQVVLFVPRCGYLNHVQDHYMEDHGRRCLRRNAPKKLRERETVLPIVFNEDDEQGEEITGILPAKSLTLKLRDG